MFAVFPANCKNQTLSFYSEHSFPCNKSIATINVSVRYTYSDSDGGMSYDLCGKRSSEHRKKKWWFSDDNCKCSTVLISPKTTLLCGCWDRHYAIQTLTTRFILPITLHFKYLCTGGTCCIAIKQCSAKKKKKKKKKKKPSHQTIHGLPCVA